MITRYSAIAACSEGTQSTGQSVADAILCWSWSFLVFKKRMHQLVQVLTRYHHRCKKQDERIILIAVLIDKHGISFALVLANCLGKKNTLLIFCGILSRRRPLCLHARCKPLWFHSIFRNGPHAPKAFAARYSSFKYILIHPTHRNTPIYRLSVELIDILSICTSFSRKVCVTGMAANGG